ncbi:hypothetical protein JK361_35060 [Streptomyces sp. 5-8]|uniref:Uncharacterized protein n=1 Tax=Streptomyces musisoli TaxID=2802280 RepID=A0ABS1PBH9_9ACTN|nr:hypothetical protein [Streptomyces musisoli]MBL1109737.1 hypothetical protein [Streptomyces musisoli]
MVKNDGPSQGMRALAVAAQVLIGVLREGLSSANIQAQIAALVVVSAVCGFVHL